MTDPIKLAADTVLSLLAEGDRWFRCESRGGRTTLIVDVPGHERGLVLNSAATRALIAAGFRSVETGSPTLTGASGLLRVYISVPGEIVADREDAGR